MVLSAFADNDPLTAAQSLYREKDYVGALAQAQELLTSEDPDLVRQAKLLIGNCQRVLTQYDEAIATYEELLAENDQDETAVSCLAGLADCLLQRGDFEPAEALLDRALAMYPEVTDAALAARGSSLYSRNRAQYEGAVDFACGQLSKLASAYTEAGDDTAALLAYRKLYLTYPQHRGAPEVALKIGDLLRERGSHEWAIPFYLALLDAGGDRCYSDTAKLSVNQRYLDVVAKPPPEERTQRAFAGLNACIAELAPSEALGEDVLRRFADAWQRALAETYKPFSDEWLARWQSMAERVRRDPWSTLCHLAIGHSLMRDAYYSEAIATLSAVEPNGPATGALRQRLNCALAEAHLGLRHFDEARRYAQGAACGPDRVVASGALLLLARTCECELDFAAAERAYRVAASDGCVAWDRCLAEYALTRIAILSEKGLAETHDFMVLPDDRTTRGEWHLCYGSEAFVLCAQQSPNDIWGGPVDLNYRPYTGSDREQHRLWISKAADRDPAALYNPVARGGRPANWDDRGEQTTIGSGPDLLVDLTVPEGPHRLSLYFVNDHNYYEPSRHYTISVSDEADRLLGVTEVKSFGGGLYKRFAAAGPMRLTVRIWRDLSINTLLSGVFLDGIEPPASATGIQALPTERAAFQSAVHRLSDELGAEAALTWLQTTTRAAFDRRQFGLAQWAASAKTEMLLAQADRAGAKQHLRDTVKLFLTEMPLFAPIPISVAYCLPYVETAYGQYLALEAKDLEGPALAAFLRKEAHRYRQEDEPALMRLALSRLQEAVGEDGLTVADHKLLTACSEDPTEDIARLETLIAEMDDPGERRELQMLLLGRYFKSRQPEKAQELAQALEQDVGGVVTEGARRGREFVAANAVYNVGVYYFQIGEYEEAEKLLGEVVSNHPDSHFARYARGYLDRIASREQE